MSRTPEAVVKKAVRRWLVERDIWFYSPVQMGMGVVGIPDFICCKPTTITPDMVGQRIGVFMAIETKAPGKIADVTPNQQARLTEIWKAGGIARVVDDVSQLKENENG